MKSTSDNEFLKEVYKRVRSGANILRDHLNADINEKSRDLEERLGERKSVAEIKILHMSIILFLGEALGGMSEVYPFEVKNVIEQISEISKRMKNE